jgi:putative endonuclease
LLIELEQMSPKRPAVYIVASAERGTLYVGVTGWLKHRIWAHREGVVDGFSKKHGLHRLVWYERFSDFPSAIAPEKQLKKWNRAWKIELIEKENPNWEDRWADLLD